MKRKKGIVGLFLLLAFVLTSSTMDNTVELKIDFKGIETDSGTVRIGVYTKDTPFPVYKKQYKALIVPVKGKSAQGVIRLPAGEKYAIAAYHDKNSNEKMDKNMFGVPEELYGFSRDARATFSAPSFDEAAFVLDKPMQISIQLR